MTISRREVAKLSGSEEYADYLIRARRRFEQGQAATYGQVRDVYKRAAEEIRKDITGLTPGVLRTQHLAALQTALDKRAAEMGKEVIAATHQGIVMASAAGSEGVADVSAHMMRDVFSAPQVKRLFAGINERATLAMLARTRADGLKISDRIWRTSERARNSVRIIVEDAVARGQDSRTTARQVQQYLQPGVWTAHKEETRRRLGVHKDISYEAMRLARTEMNNAFHEGMLAANQHSPGYQGIYWRLSAARVMPRPDICDDMAASTLYGAAGFYPKGQEPVRPHPACLCVPVASWEGPEQFANRLRAWVENPQSHPDLETWYNQDARRYMGRPMLPITLKEAPLTKALREKEAEIAVLSHERAYVLNKNGRVVLTKDGSVNQIWFEPDEMDLMKGKNLIFTHNHPTWGGSFSPDDIIMGIRVNAAEIRVVGRTYKHRLMRPRSGWPDTQVVKLEAKEADLRVRSRIQGLLDSGKITIDEASRRHWHEVWSEVGSLKAGYIREVR